MEKEKIQLPKNLHKVSKTFVESVIQELRERGILDKAVDSGALYLLASNYNTFILANELVDKEGMTITSPRGTVSVHPAVKIANTAEVQLLKIMQEFGLMPKSRKHVAPAVEETQTEFESFLGEQ